MFVVKKISSASVITVGWMAPLNPAVNGNGVVIKTILCMLKNVTRRIAG